MIEQRRASHAERILSSHVPEPIVSRPPEPELVADVDMGEQLPLYLEDEAA